MNRPPDLKIGDNIAIAAPARKISHEELRPAFEIIKMQGFNVVYNDNLFSSDNQFAGNDELRTHEIQNYLDNPDIKAIFFARGGYGSVRIVDYLDFSRFQQHPKWLVGYSDITVILNHLIRNFGTSALHATMPVNFANNSSDSLEMLFNTLSGGTPEITGPYHKLNIHGSCQGKIVGGNLSVLYSLIGSKSFPYMEGNILFIEDLDEYLYHIDRMIMGLKRAQVFKDLKGVIVGGMTDMNDNAVPFGSTAEEIIYEHLKEYDYPVCFGFPAGHSDRNLPLIIGGNANFIVNSSGFQLEYI